MRFLFSTIPGTSHMLPLVPLAHAAQATGHDVLVATSGPALSTAAGAGLLAIAVDDGEARRSYDKLADMVTERTLGLEMDAETLAVVASVFSEIGASMIDGLVDVGKAWGADAVVHPPSDVAGVLAAGVLGVPAVVHGIGKRHPLFRKALEHLVPVARRLGVAELPEADVQLNLNPPSLEPIVQDLVPQQESDIPELPMRYSSYSGGAELPRWVFQGGSRPRVVATLGSLPKTVLSEGALMREIVLGTEDLGMEVVVTTGGAALSALPSPLPEHVTLVDWLPMSALLATCEGIVHHGGTGTTYSAFAAGVPQLVIPSFEAPRLNALAVVARGAGSMLDMSDATAAALGPAVEKLLANPAYREASREVASEMRAMPEPSTVIDQVTELVGDGADQG